jgi:ABC-type multidrug transport system fused ATPase/permease subunit
MEGVSFAYPEAEQGPVVRAVTLEIPANGTTALVGPSGGGKTTLADLLIGLLQPQEGEILVDGAPLASLDLRAWRRGMGYVAQESFLFNDTIRANLTMEVGGEVTGSDAAANGEGEPAETGDADARLFAALAAAGLEGFVRGLPRGLDTVVGERGVRLSGGERQRLALARALIRRPRLLILDEATSALDYESEALIRDALGRLKGEMTVVMITHRLYLARDADRVHVMEEGRLVESGTWDELMAGGGRFAALSASSRAGA